MYAASDDRTVYLGLPSKGKIIAREKDLLKISHIGGQVVSGYRSPHAVDLTYWNMTI